MTNRRRTITIENEAEFGPRTGPLVRHHNTVTVEMMPTVRPRQAHVALDFGPSIAIRHAPEAVALHAKNHPTHGLPGVVAGKRLAIMWVSPSCSPTSKVRK